VSRDTLWPKQTVAVSAYFAVAKDICSSLYFSPEKSMTHTRLFKRTLSASAMLLAAVLPVFAVSSATAQRYTAKQEGDVVTLTDTVAKMTVPVVTTFGRPWQIQVNGQNLVRTTASLEAFRANAGLNGIPLLAPFANRLDETAFYANGKKYTFDMELGNVRGPIPGTGFVGASKDWQLVGFKADAKGAWVTCRLDFYKIPLFMKQFPFAHTITLTYRVADSTLEVHTKIDNLSNDPMPAVLGFHPIYELPVGNRDDWTVSTDAKTHWIEIPERLPTGETQPIEKFFDKDSSRKEIHLKNYALIDDVFTDLDRDANGRATVRLMYNGKELDEILGPKYKTVLMWSTPLSAAAGAGGGGRPGGAGRPAGPPPAPSGPFPVDPAKGVKVAPPAVASTTPSTAKGFIAFEPMIAITDAMNLAQKGVYKDLQTIPPGGSWEESFWVTTKGW
jgi:aldose 1-epimerase